MLARSPLVSLILTLMQLVALIFDFRKVSPQLLHLFSDLLAQSVVLTLHDLSAFKLILMVIFEGLKLP